jgi:flagellar biosynthetic protein FliR
MTTAMAVASILVLLRVSAFVVFLPPFSGGQIPRSVKLGLAMCLSVLWGLKIVPGVAAELNPAISGSWLLLLWLAIREVVFGSALGWLLGLVLIPIRVAGAYIVQEMGLTMAAVTSASDATETNVISQILEAGAVLLLFGLNIHHQFLRLFNLTWEVFPLGRIWQLPGQDWFIGSIIHSSDLGLWLAAPVAVVMFAGLVATLFVMRQSPQFNLFSFGMPARLVIGGAGLFWFLPGILSGIVHVLKNFSSFASL